MSMGKKKKGTKIKSVEDLMNLPEGEWIEVDEPFILEESKKKKKKESIPVGMF